MGAQISSQEDGQTLDTEIARHTFPTPLNGIFQTVVILETPAGDVYATVAAHARDQEPPENATCTVTDEAEVARLAAEVVAAKRAERPRPIGTQMLSRANAEPSWPAEG